MSQNDPLDKEQNRKDISTVAWKENGQRFNEKFEKSIPFMPKKAD